MKNLFYFGMVLGIMASGCASNTGNYRSKEDGIFSYKVGKYDLYMLVEGENNGNAGILVGADKAILDRYIPAEGFRHSTNAFLLKDGKRNILFDAGTGSAGALIEKIKKLGVQPEDIDAVFITHLHADHFGGLAQDNKAAYPNAKIYLSSAEHRYFTATNANQRAVSSLALYSSNVTTFEPTALSSAFNEIIPGISAINAYGHTPGHVVYQIEDNGEKFLIIGDLMHIELVQFAMPEISATYDADKEAAAAIRKAVLDYAAQNKIPVGGMHIPYPGIRNVSRNESGFTSALAQ